MKKPTKAETQRRETAAKKASTDSNVVIRECCADHVGGGTFTWSEKAGANGKCPGRHFPDSF